MQASVTHKVLICLGSSCYSRGNAENLNTIKAFLVTHNIESKIDFRGHLCNEMCNKGPVVEIDDHVFEGVTQSNLPTILSNHFDKTICI